MFKLFDFSAYLFGRHQYFLECIKHGRKKNWAVAMLILMWSILVFLSVVPTFVNMHFPRLSPWWALTGTFAAIAFIAIEGGFRIAQEKDRQIADLQHEIDELASSTSALSPPNLPQSEPAKLKYLGYSVLGFDAAPGSYVFLVEIRNGEDRFSHPVRNVSVSMEFEHITGKIKAEGAWRRYEPGGGNLWYISTSIPMGESRCFPLFYYFQSVKPFKYHPIDSRGMNINPFHILMEPIRPEENLALGEWRIQVVLRGDNIAEAFYWTINLSPNDGPRLISGPEK